MKKSTKLLSVILAIVMIFSSMSVLASAAKANYQTVADLDANKAYSPYGEVTRLATEERMSIVLDYLDTVLATTNITGSMDLSILGKLTYDVTSVNGVLRTVDSVKTLLSNNAGLLITLKDAYTLNQNFKVWNTGITREGNNQLAIVKELLQLLQSNADVLFNILKRGSLNLGGIGNAIIGGFMDMGSFNAILGDIPGLIKGFVYPLFGRWDDPQARMTELENTAGNGGLEAMLNDFLNRLFKNNMSITTYVENAAGECVSDHSLPMTEGTRWYFTRGTSDAGEYLQLSSYDTEKKAYVTEEENRYFKTLEEQDEDYKGPDRYVYTKTNEDGTKENLKYYKNDSQFLPSFAAALTSGAATLNLTNDSPAELLYRFIPYVFNDMAPVVLNGSVKKLFAQLLGAKFTYIGEVGSAEVAALGPDTSDVFFTQEQGKYLWEWSDYKVINGNHYYRFEDQIYAGDINDVTKYFSLINWDWKVENGAIDEFVPTFDAQGNLVNSPAGYPTVFQALNDFVAKVIDIAATPELKNLMGWEEGSNDKIVANIKRAARALLPIEPEAIFGSNYTDPTKYYDLIMTAADDQDILIGVACSLLDFLMPQLILPKADAIKGQKVQLGAVLAAVIRELATQFVPTYNYDDLIYADYNNKTFVAGKTNSYWLDVCLTMGVDIGMSYLRSLADLGEDTADGYKFEASKVYKRANFVTSEQAGNTLTYWETVVDWILDWALTDQYEWCWGMGKFVSTYEDIDLATAQDPWVKLSDVLGSILPVGDILNVDTTKSNWAEIALKDNFVLAILGLDFTKIVGGANADGLFNIPTGSILRQKNVYVDIVTVVRDLLNKVLAQVTEGDFIPETYSVSIRETGLVANTSNYSGQFRTVDDFLNQQNLAFLVRQLLNQLYVAVGGKTYDSNQNDISDNGLLDVLMPFANFFLGWKTDPQVMGTPSIAFSNPASREYITATGSTATTTMRVINTASGMLLKHRANNGTDGNNLTAQADSAYTLRIEGISCDGGALHDLGYTVANPLIVAPGAIIDVPLTFDYTADTAIMLDIAYSFVGKDGNAVGGQQHKIVYQFISNIIPDSEEGGRQAGDGDEDYTGIGEWNKYVFTKNIYSTIVNYTQTINYVPAKYSKPNRDFNYVKVGTAMTAPANQYFAIITSQAEAGWIQRLNEDNPSSTGKLYKAINGTTEKTEFPYGIFDMGAVYLRYGTKADKVWDPDFIYYNDYDIDTIVKKYEDMNLSRSIVPDSARAELNEFKAALTDAKKLSIYPFKTDYVDTIQPLIPDAIKRLDNAYKALSKAMGAASAADDSALVPSVLKDAFTAEDDAINYQDYELYEYFNYQDAKAAVSNRISAYTAPAKPEKHIKDSGLTAAEIDALIAGAPEKKALGINNTVDEPTAKELAAYAKTRAEWTAPNYSNLDNTNLAELMGYYRSFLGTQKKAVNKDFLKTEIDYANKQGYVAADYAAESWAAYQSALADAVAVYNDNNALQSRVFDAKYQLMKAQNELLRKDRSVKELGLLANLEALVAQAETIFNYSQYYAPKANITEADAYGALIKALGYTYTDEDGNEQILYNRSAAEFLKYDRENTATGLARVAAAEAALKAAIDNFECTVKLVENDGDKTTEVAQGVKIINGITPGSIASIDALMNHVKASVENAVATPTASASGFFGTGAKVDLSIEGIGVLTTYYVVIYGDVNGDGAIDAFDAAVVNQNINTGATLNGVYKDAAMVTRGDDVELADYSAIFGAAVGAQEIDQNRA